jgi:hypothetical protein
MEKCPYAAHGKASVTLSWFRGRCCQQRQGFGSGWRYATCSQMVIVLGGCKELAKRVFDLSGCILLADYESVGSNLCSDAVGASCVLAPAGRGPGARPSSGRLITEKCSLRRVADQEGGGVTAGLSNEFCGSLCARHCAWVVSDQR